MERVKIPTIVGIFLLTISLPIAVVLIKQKQIFRLGAQQDYPPQDVKITNVTDSSFTVIWSTQQQTTGFVQWGESENKLDQTASTEIETKSYLHSSTVSGLRPNRKYYFKINSNGNTYGNGQSPWEIKTGPEKSTDAPSGNFRIGGKVITASGSEASNILIIVQIEGGYPLSTVTSPNGNWIISTDTVLDNNLSNYITLSPDTKVSVIAQGGPQGISTAEFYLRSGEYLPPMVLGENHDFTNVADTAFQESMLPSSEVNAPNKTQKKARFDTETQATKTTGQGENLSIDSIEDGEIIYTTKPEFFGKAPSQEEITIKVESENPISETIRASQNGVWRWSPRSPLSPGEHKITITYQDESGVLKRIVKNFVVQASESNEPAFESTPSASLMPTIIPQPTATTSAQKTASPSATPAQPVSGTKTPTLILISIGLLLFATSGFLLFAD